MTFPGITRALIGSKEPIIVHRVDSMLYDEHGRPTGTREVVVDMLAVVVPGGSDELLAADEGYRQAKDVQTFYTIEELRTVQINALNGSQPDVVEHKGIMWRIYHVHDYTFHGGFFESVGERVQQ